jgi:hypothetical protein
VISRDLVGRARTLLVLLPVLLAAFPAAVAALPADASGPLAFAAALAAGLVILVAVSDTGLRLNPAATPAWARTLSLRDRAERTVYLPLRDPDARGRTRPRAPSAA